MLQRGGVMEVHIAPINRLETSHTWELEKCSVVNVVKSILGGVITGLIFLHLWEKDGALRLGTVPTGQ
ncbi:hypothetical protein FD755_003417 [Muntiacus reevesi]|uniref:Uncharacterized protein n=1 Tax=Muntiacus reevesi TaxID=9886 RepID=A0A5J5MMB5_MUNRE|nr:hypothetical protein FD755_003417 [Muntiacus reevesi]